MLHTNYSAASLQAQIEEITRKLENWRENFLFLMESLQAAKDKAHSQQLLQEFRIKCIHDNGLQITQLLMIKSNPSIHLTPAMQQVHSSKLAELFSTIGMLAQQIEAYPQEAIKLFEEMIELTAQINSCGLQLAELGKQKDAIGKALAELFQSPAAAAATGEPEIRDVTTLFSSLYIEEEKTTETSVEHIVTPR